MKSNSYLGCIQDSLKRILKEKDTVFLGEDICEPYGGAFKVSKGLSKEFPNQIINTPMSEQGFVGMAIGLSLSGMKTIVEIMFGDFVTLIMDQLLNHASKFCWLYEKKLHLVIRTPMGGYRGYGATHSQSLEKLFFGLPNIFVIAPSILGDPGTILTNSLNIGKPTLFIENKLDYTRKLFDKENGTDNYLTKSYGTLFPLYEVIFDEEDCDLTLITYGGLVYNSLELQKSLMMEEEISIKILCPTMISPFDFDQLFSIIKNDKKILIIEEGHVPFGWGDTILSQIIQRGFKGNIKTMGAKNNVIGASKNLEDKILPNFKDILKNIVNWID